MIIFIFIRAIAEIVTKSGRRLGVVNMLSHSARRLVRRGAISRTFASIGNQLPSVELHIGFPPKKHNLADFVKDKSILLVGLPGHLLQRDP